MRDDQHNSETKETDPEKLAKLLEIELMQKRAGWQAAKARRGGVRALSFIFLFLVIVGALVAAYFLLSPEHVEELRNNAAVSPSPTVVPR